MYNESKNDELFVPSHTKRSMLSFLSKEIVLSCSLNNLPITLYLHTIKSGDIRVATLTADNALVYVQNTISQNTHDSTHPLIIYL